MRASVVIAAYNLAEYLPRAIDSALAQISPGGPIEVIVVDDGSTDATPSVIASYGDRIRAIRQSNAGTNTAIDRGIGAATGEFIALLDSDDEWPRDRLQRHVAALTANPMLGLVHGDMEVIDTAGNVLQPSYFATQPEQPPASGRVLGRLLSGNFVSGGASTFRASLKPAYHPMIAEAAYHDWAIAACIACVAEVGLIDGIANRYRLREGNDSLGRPITEMPRVQERELEWRRWMFRNVLDDTTIATEDLRRAHASFQYGLTVAASAKVGGPRALLDPDRAAAEQVLRKLPALGVGSRRSRALLRALADDPFDGALAIELTIALMTEAQLPRQVADQPLIALESSGPLVVAWLDEVLKRPKLLTAFAEEHSGTGTTLAILAPPLSNLDPLVKLFDADPQLASDECDVMVVPEPQTTPARRLLAARASRQLSMGPPDSEYAGLGPDPALERVAHVPLASIKPAGAPRPKVPRPKPGEPIELTVVIPTLHFAAEHLRMCVAAVHAATNVAHQVVIVDNSSPPQGFAGPVNAGIRSAYSPYVVVMNDDVEPLDGWWEPLRTALDDGAAVAFPFTVDGQMRHDFAAWCFAMTSETVRRFSVLPGEFFDPQLVVWYQDTDLLERLCQVGNPPVQVSESQIRHLESQTLETSDRVLRGWIDARIGEDERNFRAKHPHVGDVAAEWSAT